MTSALINDAMRELLGRGTAQGVTTPVLCWLPLTVPQAREMFEAIAQGQDCNPDNVPADRAVAPILLGRPDAVRLLRQHASGAGEAVAREMLDETLAHVLGWSVLLQQTGVHFAAWSPSGLLAIEGNVPYSQDPNRYKTAGERVRDAGPTSWPILLKDDFRITLCARDGVTGADAAALIAVLDEQVLPVGQDDQVRLVPLTDEMLAQSITEVYGSAARAAVVVSVAICAMNKMGARGERMRQQMARVLQRRELRQLARAVHRELTGAA